MQKLGMKPVPGVERVTIKKSKNVRSHSLDEHVQHSKRFAEQARAVQIGQSLLQSCILQQRV